MKIIVLSLLLVLGACKIKVKDGKIPAEHEGLAQKYTGTYETTINGVTGNLIVKLDGLRPVVMVSDFPGNDILGEDCRSSIGDLQRVKAKKNKETKELYIRELNFDFNAGNCRELLNGDFHSLTFKFEKELTANASTQLDSVYIESFSIPDFHDDGFPHDHINHLDIACANNPSSCQ